MKRFLAILGLLAYALVPSLRVAAIDYNGNPNDKPDPANNIIFYDGDIVINTCTGAASTLSGKDNIAKAFNFLVGLGLTAPQAAGIVGNLKQESGVDPGSLQAGGGGGKGIAQWGGGRYDNLVAYAKTQNKPWNDIGVQLQFMWNEAASQTANNAGNYPYLTMLQALLTGTSGSTNAQQAVKLSTTASMSASAWLYTFERAGIPAEANRITNATDILAAYSGGGATAGSAATSGGSCGGAVGGSVVSGDIVKSAVGLAWPTNVGHVGPDSATPAYKAAWNGSSDMTDCGAFVGTVMVKSGVDPNYPHVSAIAQYNYVKAHPEKYQIITSVKSASELVPGDILIHSSHTMIYVGPQAGGFVTADASLHDHPPQLDTPGHLLGMLANKETIVARVIK